MTGCIHEIAWDWANTCSSPATVPRLEPRVVPWRVLENTLNISWYQPKFPDVLCLGWISFDVTGHSTFQCPTLVGIRYAHLILPRRHAHVEKQQNQDIEKKEAIYHNKQTLLCSSSSYCYNMCRMHAKTYMHCTCVVDLSQCFTNDNAVDCWRRPCEKTALSLYIPAQSPESAWLLITYPIYILS